LFWQEQSSLPVTCIQPEQPPLLLESEGLLWQEQSSLPVTCIQPEQPPLLLEKQRIVLAGIRSGVYNLVAN